MRRWGGLAIVFAAVAAGGCEPVIADGTYLCGPNRSCPPDQDCDDATITCGDPLLIERFECPVGTQDGEPDDTPEQAIVLGSTTCGEVLIAERPACIGDGTDVDVYRFEHAQSCPRTNQVDVAISFPFAFVPLQLEILDADGAVIGSGEICTIPNSTLGREQVCASADLAPGPAFVRVTPLVGQGQDCNGDCRYNQYILDVAMAL